MRAQTPSLGVGLHVDLGEWEFRNGEWVQLYDVVDRAIRSLSSTRSGPSSTRFRRLMGREPTHIDSHQHVHQLRAEAASSCRIASELGVPLREHTPRDTPHELLRPHPPGCPARRRAAPWSCCSTASARLYRGVTELGCHPGDQRRHGFGVRPRARPGGRDPVRSRACARRSSASGVELRIVRGHRFARLRLALRFRLYGTRQDSLCGSPACRGRARARSPASSPVACARSASSGSRCSTATSCARACAGTSASPARTATENIRRIAFVSKLLTRNGVAVIVAAISPYREDRELAREEIQSFVEVWCHASVDACAARDYKGLYEKARRGEIDEPHRRQRSLRGARGRRPRARHRERAARAQRRARDGAPARARATCRPSS